MSTDLWTSVNAKKLEIFYNTCSIVTEILFFFVQRQPRRSRSRVVRERAPVVVRRGRGRGSGRRQPAKVDGGEREERRHQRKRTSGWEWVGRNLTYYILGGMRWTIRCRGYDMGPLKCNKRIKHKTVWDPPASSPPPVKNLSKKHEPPWIWLNLSYPPGFLAVCTGASCEPSPVIKLTWTLPARFLCLTEILTLLDTGNCKCVTKDHVIIRLPKKKDHRKTPICPLNHFKLKKKINVVLTIICVALR